MNENDSTRPTFRLDRLLCRREALALGALALGSCLRPTRKHTLPPDLPPVLTLDVSRDRLGSSGLEVETRAMPRSRVAGVLAGGTEKSLEDLARLQRDGLPPVPVLVLRESLEESTGAWVERVQRLDPLVESPRHRPWIQIEGSVRDRPSWIRALKLLREDRVTGPWRDSRWITRTGPSLEFLDFLLALHGRVPDEVRPGLRGISLRWTGEEPATVHLGTAGASEPESLELEGTEGRAVLTSSHLRLRTSGPERELELESGTGEDLEAFALSVREKLRPRGDLDDALALARTWRRLGGTV